VPKEFPNEAPKLFAKNAVENNLIDKATMEVNYKAYFQWDRKNSKALDLVQATEKYFTEHNPFLK